MKLRQPSFGTKLVTLESTLPTTTTTKGCILLSILDELDTDTLSDGRVGLFGLNADFLEDDSLSVGCSLERRGFPGCAEGAFAEMLVGPSVLSAVDTKLARCVETRGFSFTHLGGWRCM